MVIALVVLTWVDAYPKEKLSAMDAIKSKDFPNFKGKFKYTLLALSEDKNKNNYSFDGQLVHTSKPTIPAGSISVGCQRSGFLSGIFALDVGQCVMEIVLVENNELLGVVTASGTSLFSMNSGSTLTITGGDACTLGATGRVDYFENTLELIFE